MVRVAGQEERVVGAMVGSVVVKKEAAMAAVRVVVAAADAGVEAAMKKSVGVGPKEVKSSSKEATGGARLAAAKEAARVEATEEGSLVVEAWAIEAKALVIDAASSGVAASQEQEVAVVLV